MSEWPQWIRPGVRAWHHTSMCVVEKADAKGVVLARYRRRLSPTRRLLSPAEAAHALEYGDLRPAEQDKGEK